MHNKIIIIISTAELDKARTGAMYALNALKNNWMDDVKLYFFGPSQELLIDDDELQRMVSEFNKMNKKPIACKYFAEKNNNSILTTELGVKVEYVGEQISELIKDGYLPLVW